MQKWDTVDLFCPHPFLRKQKLSQVTPATSPEDDSELPCGLLTTTAFRSPKPQTQSPPQHLRALVVTLLQIWQQVRPEDVHRYAVALRPAVSQIFGLYLRGQFPLSRDEVVQVRELGRIIVEHCRSLDDVEAESGRNNAAHTVHRLPYRLRGHIGIGTRVAIGDTDLGGRLSRT